MATRPASRYCCRLSSACTSDVGFGSMAALHGECAGEPRKGPPGVQLSGASWDEQAASRYEPAGLPPSSVGLQPCLWRLSWSTLAGTARSENQKVLPLPG